MAFLAKVTLFLSFFAYLLVISIPVLAVDQEATLSLKAMVANKGLGCDISLPEALLQFKPLKSNQLMNDPQTYQIKPLRLQLRCVDEHEAVLPTLTIEGETPYADDTEQVIFLNGTTNGVGFMLRQSSEDKPIALADFYQPAAAIGQGGQGTPLTVLNNDNLYISDHVLWVGLVGPFQSNIIPGYFQASLTLNVAFE